MTKQHLLGILSTVTTVIALIPTISFAQQLPVVVTPVTNTPSEPNPTQQQPQQQQPIQPQPTQPTQQQPIQPPTSSSPAPTVERVSVDGSPIRAGRAAGEFDAPFEVVSALITDFAHYRDFMPRITESRVVQRRRGEVDVYFSINLMDNMGTLWSLTRFTIQRTSDSIVVEGHAINDGLRRLDCRLEATAIAGTRRTRVAVQMLALPAIPFPDFVVDTQQLRSPQRGFIALRERAEASARTLPSAVVAVGATTQPVTPPSTTQ